MVDDMLGINGVEIGENGYHNSPVGESGHVCNNPPDSILAEESHLLTGFYATLFEKRCVRAMRRARSP